MMQLVDFMSLVDEYAQCVVTYKEERARSLRAQRTLDAYEFAKEARQVLESALLDLLPDNAGQITQRSAACPMDRPVNHHAQRKI